MKLADLQKLSKEELEKQLVEHKKQMFNLSSVTLTGEDFIKKKTKRKSVKITIARIKTLLNQKEG
ncbi:MAG: 50S ribosomal protein L29 [Candidatus Woesearchaeota archaeon]